MHSWLHWSSGPSTEAIAHAFLVSPSTPAQGIVRAKAKIRDARIPCEGPALEELPQRLDGVLQVIYLVFKESYRSVGGLSTGPEPGAPVTRTTLFTPASA